MYICNPIRVRLLLTTVVFKCGQIIIVEKKNVTKTTTKRTATKKACVKKAPVKVDLSSENVGFKAGDVYNALVAENRGLAVSEIAKTANISIEEAYLGIGWLLKEGKINSEDEKLVLA